MDGGRNDVIDGDAPETVVRTLRMDDGPRLVKIDAAITGRSRSLWFTRKLENALKHTDVCVSVGAERNGLLLGALMGTIQFGEFGLPEPVAVLDTVLVDPAYAGKGVARAMFRQFLTNLRALGVTRVRTEVAWTEHNLMAFFERVGFTPAPRLVLERDMRDLEPAASSDDEPPARKR